MTKLSEIMQREIVSISPYTTIEQAALLMRDHDVGVLPVVENGRAKGILTDRDIVVRGLTSNRANMFSRASDIMTTDLRSCRANDDIEVAVGAMARYQLHRIIVVDDDGLVCGILSLSDLIDGHEDAASFALSEICKAAQFVETPESETLQVTVQPEEAA